VAPARAGLFRPPGLDHVQRLQRPLVAGQQGRRDRMLKQLVGEPLGELAQVGPGDPEPVHRRRRPRIVVTAVREHRAQWPRVVRGHEDRVVGDRAQRDGGGSLGLGLGTADLSEHARQYAEADRRLVGLALNGAAGQQHPQRTQRGGLVLVAPQLFEVRRKRLERRLGDLGDQGEDRLRQGQPPAAREREVGHQRGGARRPVDQRHALLRRELHARAEVVEQPAEREDLPRATVALGGDRGQRRVEHRGHRLRDRAAYRRVALDEVAQTGQQDRPHDAVGQRLAETVPGPQPGRPA
jgi:hypothetical protein